MGIHNKNSIMILTIYLIVAVIVGTIIGFMMRDESFMLWFIIGTVIAPICLIYLIFLGLAGIWSYIDEYMKEI